MKYREQPKDRLQKLAHIYTDANSISEYKCKADLENIRRNNYLLMFDPFVFHWLIKSYGFIEVVFTIGISVSLACFFLCLMFCSLDVACIGSICVFIAVEWIFVFGEKIANKYVL